MIEDRMSRNLPGSLTRANWPTRERALELVDTLVKGGTVDASEADRCFYVYGYPELEAGNVARALAAASMMPKTISGRPQTPPPEPPDYSFGIGPRR